MTDTYKSAADCPLGDAHGDASTHGNAKGVRCCDWCGFPVEADTVVKSPERAALEQVASSFGDLMRLRQQQSATQAKLIRWCVMAITQTSDQALRALERERHDHPKPYKRIVRMHEPGKKVRDDRELALLYLQWLATKLENDGPSPEPSELDIRVEAAILAAQ